MKKKTTEISINTSSGAEKVERIEKQTTTKHGEGQKEKESVKKRAPLQKSAKGAAALGDGEKIKEQNASSTNGKAEAESKAAKDRVDAALKRKQDKEARRQEKKERSEKKAAEKKKRLAEKKAVAEKRAADKKAKAAKHAAERKAMIEKRQAEKEEKLRKRAHAKANRNNEQYKKKKQKAANKQKGHREERNKGYGGWIAAVVSLGVVSLALATTVTVGAIEMNKNNEMIMNGYKGTMYELTGIMENVDSDLDRVRVSNSSAQQSRILTDLLVQTRLAELDLEKLPVNAEADRNATSFLNRTAKECERMLTKLRKGEKLSERDKQRLQALYETNHSVREELAKLNANMTDKDIAGFMKDGTGMIKDAIDKIEKSTLVENIEDFGEKAKEMAGSGMRMMPPSTEKEEKPHIEAATAEELCKEYFTGYNIGDFQCIGETVTKGYEAYNVQGYDEKGNQLFAEISQMDGKLLRFDYYEDCSGETFDIRNAERIAEEFLEKLGYDDMEKVRLRANGSTTDFTFVYEDDDVVYYPDEIRIKVCRTRGVVSGFDATKYLKNHGGRVEMNAKITLSEAYEKLNKALSVEASRMAVVDTVSGERMAYEFLCGYENERYFVFLDAVSGEEISIVNVKTVV